MFTYKYNNNNSLRDSSYFLLWATILLFPSGCVAGKHYEENEWSLVARSAAAREKEQRVSNLPKFVMSELRVGKIHNNLFCHRENRRELSRARSSLLSAKKKY